MSSKSEILAIVGEAILGLVSLNEPESRNESILQNMLGADHELLPPESRIEALLQAILYENALNLKKFSLIEEIEITEDDVTTIRRSGYNYSKMLIRGRLVSGEYGIIQTFVNELGCGWWDESNGNGVVDTFAEVMNGMFFSVYGSQITSHSGANTSLVRREVSFGQLTDTNIESIKIMNSIAFPVGTIFEIYAV